MKRHKIKICWIIYFLNNPICIVNEVKTLVLILLLLLKIQEKNRDCLQNIDSKMSGFVCFLSLKFILILPSVLCLSCLFKFGRQAKASMIIYKC